MPRTSSACLRCHSDSYITARGLCDPCYRIEHRAGTLDTNYPTQARPARARMPGDPTDRQIFHWIDRGYLRPANMGPHRGSGHRWQWDDDEWAVARLMIRLTRAGLTLAAAARVARGETDLGWGVTVRASPDEVGGHSVPTETAAGLVSSP